MHSSIYGSVFSCLLNERFLQIEDDVLTFEYLSTVCSHVFVTCSLPTALLPDANDFVFLSNVTQHYEEPHCGV